MTIRLLVLMLCMGKLSFAQTSLSGTYSLQNKEHIEGPEYGNALPTQLSLKRQADSLIIESVNIGAEGQEVKSRQAISLDGKQLTTTSKTSNRKYVKSLKWAADKKSLTITTVFYVENNPSEVDFTRVEVLTPSADGTTFIIDKKSIETRSDSWQVKGAYKKQ